MRERGVAGACVAGYVLGAAGWVALVVAGLGLFWQPRRPHWWPGLAAEVVLGSEYGYEFALVTTHLWGACGALAAYAAARGGRGVRLTGVLFGLACVALLLASVRWVGFEMLGVFGRSWGARSFFRQGINRGILLGAPLAFLAAVAWRRRRAGAPSPPRPTDPGSPLSP